jgi:hypothetical protein
VGGVGTQVVTSTPGTSSSTNTGGTGGRGYVAPSDAANTVTYGSAGAGGIGHSTRHPAHEKQRKSKQRTAPSDCINKPGAGRPSAQKADLRNVHGGTLGKSPGPRQGPYPPQICRMTTPASGVSFPPCSGARMSRFPGWA